MSNKGRRNYYKRIEAMQREYLKHQNSGRSETYIYRQFIYPQFFISRSTFYNWLAINPRKELNQIATAQANNKPQKPQHNETAN